MAQSQIQKLVSKIQSLPKADLKVVIDMVEDLIENKNVWTPSAEEKVLIEEALRSKPISGRSIKAIFKKYRIS